MNLKAFLPAITIGIFFFSFPLAARGVDSCSDNGYTIFTINGVGTDENGAEINRKALERAIILDTKGKLNSEPIIVDYLHNPTRALSVADWLKSLEQATVDSENFVDYDLTKILTDASQRLKTQKVLLVGHSQGNFYANSFYGAVAGKEGGIPKESIAVYGVASPSSFVAGGGKYITSKTDKVIAKAARIIVFWKVLPPNENIKLKNGDDFWGHSFSDIYLKYRASRIVEEIQDALSGLKASEARNTQEPCFVPPKVTGYAAFEESLFSVDDMIKKAVGELASGASQVFAAIFDAVRFARGSLQSAAGYIADSIQSAAGSVFNILQNFLAQANFFNWGFSQVSNTAGGASTDVHGSALNSSEAPAVAFGETEDESPAPTALNDLQNQLDDVLEQIDLLAAKIAQLLGVNQASPQPSLTSSGTQSSAPPSAAASLSDSPVPPDEEKEFEPEPEAEAEPDPPPEEPEDTTPKTVVINEIAWMGTRANAADEWIELYNTTSMEINIAGWRLVSSDGKPDITFGLEEDATSTVPVVIPSGGFFLIERGSDDLTTSEQADWKGSFGSGTGMGLSNNCEMLYLYDTSLATIDQTVCNNNGSWPAGDNKTKQTMERIDATKTGLNPSNWANNNLWTRNGKDADNNNINGTPRAQNSVSLPQTELTNVQIAGLFEEFEGEFNELRLPKLGSPYVITPISVPPLFRSIVIPVGKTLTIEPGVMLKFNYEDSRLLEPALKVEGALRAIGTEAEPIFFTSAIPERFWCGIFFTGTSVGSELVHAIIEKSKCTFPVGPSGVASQWALASDGAPIKITNTLFQGSENHLGSGVYLHNAPMDALVENSSFTGYDIGLFIDGGGSLVRSNTFEENTVGIQTAAGSPIIDGNVFTQNAVPARVYAGASPRFSNSAVQGGRRVVEVYPEAGIAIPGGTETRWSSDVPYVISGHISVEGRLTLDPGMIVKFTTGGLEVFGGLLEARGTPEQHIVFTSFQDDAYGGDADGIEVDPWRGTFVIGLDNPTASFELDNIIVRYGGRNSDFLGQAPARGGLFLNRGNLMLTNATIESNLKAGVEIGSTDSFVEINNVAFSSNDTGLRIWQVGGLELENSTFVDNSTHIHWSNSGGLCEEFWGSGDTNTYIPPASEETIRCEG